MKFKEKIAIRYIRTKFKILSSISKKKAAEKAFELFCTPQFRNTKDLPAVFEQAEKIRFKFQQYTIVGYRWNKGGQRKALIIHGFESSVVNFDRYVNALIKKGYEVLAFDAPAHGRSSGKQINAIIYRDFIKHVYEVYGPIQTFIAHSFGGLVICLALAELLHDENYKIVLIAPATETKTTLDLFFQFLHIRDDGVRKEFEDIILRISGYPAAWFSISRALKKIKAQVLWLHDEDDKTTPVSDVYNIRQENHFNVRYIITKGLGHRRIYRDAEVSKKIVDFV
jgi:pimeloyl-ACP methyl ester carboxylesterase